MDKGLSMIIKKFPSAGFEPKNQISRLINDELFRKNATFFAKEAQSGLKQKLL